MKTPDEIKKGLECCTIPVCAECPYDSEPSCVVKNEDALAYIQQLEAKVPKWISVKDKMPPTGNAVLVRVQSKRKTWQCIMTDMWSGDKWLENADSEWHIVTHWMPLPEPPKEE